MGVDKRRPAAGEKKKPSRAVQAPQLSAEEHYEEAEMAFFQEDFASARTHFGAAVNLDPDNMEFLDAFGAFLAEVGPEEEALSVLRTAVEKAPDVGFEKYMYLGQLLEGAEAEAAMRKGVSILRTEVEAVAAEDAALAQQRQQQQQEGEEEEEEEEDGGSDLEPLREQLASCLCSLAELLMNRAAEAEPGISSAAAEVQQLLGEARQLAPESPEPLQALASLREHEGAEEEALQLLRQSMALWFKPPKDDSDGEAEEGEGMEGEEGGKAAAQQRQEVVDLEAASEGSEEESMSEDELELPSYEFRFETAKLLLQLDETVVAASQVLEQLLDENDQVPNVWMLLAVCQQAGGELADALDAAEQGLELCRSLKLPAGDEVVAALETMQEDLQKLLAAKKQGQQQAQE